MEEAKKEITEALNILYSLTVSGQVVKPVAAIMAKREKAVSIMSKEENDG